MGLKVFVGRVFESVRRSEVVERLGELGGQVVSEVSPQTDVVVLGGFGQTRRSKGDAKKDNAARKNAGKHGIPIWDEYALKARLNREELGPLSWGAAPTTYEDGKSLTQVGVVEGRTAEDFDPSLLAHFVAFVRAFIEVTPGDFEDALDTWGDRAPFQAADEFAAEHVCDPFTLALLCSGDANGTYELRTFELNGEPFRTMVHIPAGNSVSFVFTPGGDLAWQASELSPDHTVEALGICALAQFGGPGDTLQDFVDDETIGPWVHGWDGLLPPT